MISDREIFVIHKKAKWGLYYSEDNEIINFLTNFYKIKIIDWKKTDPKSIPKGAIVFCRYPDNWISSKNKFILWLEKLSKSCILINDYETIKKGLDKNYLNLFSKNGIEVVSSIFINKPKFNLEIPWVDCVIKPTIGESALGVRKVKRYKLNNQYLNDYYHKYGPFIIQKYLKEITTEGSFSVIYINKKYVYTVSTKTKKGSFITVWDSAQMINDNKILVEKSKKCLELWGKCDYVRLDWLYSEKTFKLLEFEVVDPMFFCSCLNQKKKDLFLSELLKLFKKNAI